MRSRFITIALGLLALGWGACTKKDSDAPIEPEVPVVIPPVNRDVVDSGRVVLDMDADIGGGGGSTQLDIPDAGPRPDVAPILDAATDLGGIGASCDVFVVKPCADGLGCYPRSDGSATCQTAGQLFGGSNCEPSQSSPDSRCIPGYTCANTPSRGIPVCAALCRFGEVSAKTCADSVGTTCVRLGVLESTIGFCD